VAVILIVDNYDSFVHNLARYLVELGSDCRVIRNDATTVGEALALKPSAVVLSPGPCGPDRAGISMALALAAPRAAIPVLGVCLGHQAVAAAYGGRIRRAWRPIHGSAARMTHDGSALFDGISTPFEGGLYHSLAVELDAGGPLVASAWDDAGEVMALRHESLPAWGVQFHPESVLTPDGYRLLANFLGEVRTAGAPRVAGGGEAGR
jgi:anthranilate synthase component 2/para-aminobenzoate synthetase component 2